MTNMSREILIVVINPENKIKGTWKSTGTNTQGKSWGYEEKM